MNNIREKWLKEIGYPSYEIPHEKISLKNKYEYEEFDVEVYLQKNGPDTYQRVIMTFPKNIKNPLPAVAVPFYFPEQMLGFNPETNEVLEGYEDIAMMADLAKKRYITISAESYHLTYIDVDIWSSFVSELVSTIHFV